MKSQLETAIEAIKERIRELEQQVNDAANDHEIQELRSRLEELLQQRD